MTKRITHIAKPLLPATLTLSALMSMAACGSDSPKPSAAAGTPSVSQSQPGTAAPTQTSAPNVADTSTGTQPSAPRTGSGTGTGSATATASKPSAPKPSTAKTSTAPDSALPGDCSVSHLKGTVTNLARPINHVLLTVTNAGSTTCSVYYYPDLRLDADQQAVTQAVEDSKPQAVVTIAPGESAWAAIGTSSADGSGGTPQLEKQVEVFLESRDQSGSLPGTMTLPLPAGTYVDVDKAFVTYWQSDLQSAIAW